MKRAGLLQGLITAAVVTCLSIPLRNLGPDYWFIFSLAGLTALMHNVVDKAASKCAARRNHRASQRQP